MSECHLWSMKCRADAWCLPWVFFFFFLPRAPYWSTKFAPRTTPRTCATRKPAARAAPWTRTASGNLATRSASHCQVMETELASRARRRCTHAQKHIKQARMHTTLTYFNIHTDTHRCMYGRFGCSVRSANSVTK